MSKVFLDKYYTSEDTAKHCIEVAKKVLRGNKVTEVVEPSAGNGVFSRKIKNCIAYDIEPDHDTVIRQDFLELEIPYKAGRLTIGNPPFGSRNNLAVKFFKKSVRIGDFIAFILPISQYKNSSQMYEFDLIHSEDLGVRLYTDRELRCCWNVYKRPDNGLNKKPTWKLNDVSVIEYRRGGNEIIPDGYDYSMATFGRVSGKKNERIGQYSLECYFYIINKNLREKVLFVLKNADWKSLAEGVSDSFRLPQWKIFKHLKEQIPEIN